MQIKGIDVSHNNGVIDWEKVKASGIKFAILRAGFGKEDASQIDKQFNRNYLECKRLEIPVGAYHYSYAFSEEEAKQELDFFLKILGNKKFEYPVFYDIEDEKYVHPQLGIKQNQLSKDVFTDIAVTFCDGLEKAGYYAGLYMNSNYIINHFNYEQIKRFDIWLAQWGKKRSYPCGIWQYSEKGRVKGINGYVDLDVAYKNYPSIIKKNKLNNYGADNSTYRIEASRSGMKLITAKELANKLDEHDMFVRIYKESGK